MKKFSKALGVLSALAIIGAGFISCADDDGEEEKTPSLALEATAVTGKTGATVTSTITATLTNDSFKVALSDGADASAYVDITDSAGATSVFTSPSITFDGAVAAGATTAKVKVSATAPSDAKNGTLTFKVSLPAEALNSGKALEKTATAKYEITADSDTPTGGNNIVISPTTTGSEPAYPTDADTPKPAEYVFTSPIKYTVKTKKKFDKGAYTTDGTTKTEVDRWNCGGGTP